MTQTIPLAERLNIARDEVEATAKRINFMLHVTRQNSLKEEHVTKIYDEWVTVAKRLRKGQEMIVQTEQSARNPMELAGNKRLESLVNLYTFLLSILGFYDNFFKRMLSESHYRKFNSAILEILR